MPAYEYKVIPAPIKGQKAKGVRSTPARFANAVEILINQHAGEGWEYLRTDTLPCEERQGLRARVTVYQNLLVFRRTLQKAAEPVLPAETATVAVLPLVQEVRVAPPEPVETVAEVVRDEAPAVRLGPAVRRPEAAADAD